MNINSGQYLTIRSAEGVEFDIQLAGPMSRFIAWLIDALAISVALSMLNIVILLLSFYSIDFAMGLYMAVNFALVLSYGIVLEWFWRGQTIGKRVMHLRVIDERGLKLRFEQVILRNLLRAVDRLPFLYLLGGVTGLLTARNQRLGDIAAGTIVTYTPPTIIPDVEDINDTKYNSFRQHPHLEARLRQAISPGVAALALEAITRRDILDPQKRLDLFSQFADYFRSLVTFPEEELMGITDEQYVRNVIDTLYN